MSEPIAFVKQDKPDEVVVYACGKRGAVAGSVLTHGERAKEMAAACCGPWKCTACGEDCRHYYYTALCQKKEGR